MGTFHFLLLLIFFFTLVFILNFVSIWLIRSLLHTVVTRSTRSFLFYVWCCRLLLAFFTIAQIDWKDMERTSLCLTSHLKQFRRWFHLIKQRLCASVISFFLALLLLLFFVLLLHFIPFPLYTTVVCTVCLILRPLPCANTHTHFMLCGGNCYIWLLHFIRLVQNQFRYGYIHTTIVWYSPKRVIKRLDDWQFWIFPCKFIAWCRLWRCGKICAAVLILHHLWISSILEISRTQQHRAEKLLFLVRDGCIN